MIYWPPPIFGGSVNPISTGEGRLSPPITTGTPNVFFRFRHHRTCNIKLQYVTQNQILPEQSMAKIGKEEVDPIVRSIL